MRKKLIIPAVLVFGFSTMFQGCQTTPAQDGAMGGAAVGAIAGQLIGRDTESTLIGAGAGALGGAIFNDWRVKSEQKSYEKGYRDGVTSYPPPPPPPTPTPYNTAPR